ncbi:MAG: hypothetical protein ACRCVI_02565 [Mycoplasmoidaceae bacterium]
MNRKIKLSLISSLLIGMSLSVVLPIVSCSSTAETKLTINKQVDNLQITNNLGTALAKQGKASITNNRSVLTEAEFANITKDYTSKDTEVWNATKAFFQVTDEGGRDIFNEAIGSLTVSGTYAGAVGTTQLNVTIKLNPKSGYSASGSLLAHEVQVGISAIVDLNIVKNDAYANEVGMELAKIAKPGSTNNNGVILKDQVDPIINKTYPVAQYTGVFDALGKYLTIKNSSGGNVTLTQAVTSYRLTATYPPAGASTNVMVNFNLTLRDGFAVSDQGILIFGIKIGVSQQTLTITKGDANALAVVGAAIAKVGKDDAANNAGIITKDQYTTIIETSYAKSNAAVSGVWNALNGYYTFTKVGTTGTVNFSDAVETITLTSIAYPTKADDPINVKLTFKLKVDYLAGNPAMLEIDAVQVGTAQGVLTLTINNTTTLLNQLGHEIAKVANPSATSNNGIITRRELLELKTHNFTFEANPEVWTVLNQIFLFSGGGLPTRDLRVVGGPVQSLTLTTPTYPIEINADIMLSIKLNLNPNYVLEAGEPTPEITFKLGRQQTLANATVGDNTLYGKIQDALYAITNIPNANTPLLYADFLKIKNDAPKDPAVKTALMDYLKFTYIDAIDNPIHGTPIDYDQIVESISIINDYPVTYNDNVRITLRVNVYDYVWIDPNDVSKLSMTFVLGKALNIFTIFKGEQIDKTRVANEFAKIANASFTSASTIDHDEFNTVLGQTYSQVATPGVWSALGQYFNITKILNGQQNFTFDQVVDTITVSGTYPDSQAATDVELFVQLNFKPTYSMHASASSSSETFVIGQSENKISIDHSKDPLKLAAVGTAFARIGNIELEDNQSNLTQTEFNAIINEPYSNADDEVWNALGEFFLFNAGSTTLTFSNVVKSIAVTGTYPVGTPNTELEVRVVITTKDEYRVLTPSLLQAKFVVGKTDNTLTVVTDNTRLDAVGRAFARVADSANFNNTGFMTLGQFNGLLDRTYSSTDVEVWDELNRLYSFTFDGEQTLSFNTVASGITVSGTYPPADNTLVSVPIMLALTVVPKPEYAFANSALLSTTFQIGIRYQQLSAYLNEEVSGQRDVIAAEIAGLVNPGALNNNEPLTLEQFNTLKEMTLTKENGVIFNRVLSLYRYQNYNANSFNENPHVDSTTAVKAIKFFGTYPSASNTSVYITIRYEFNNGYYMQNVSSENVAYFQDNGGTIIAKSFIPS